MSSRTREPCLDAQLVVVCGQHVSHMLVHKHISQGHLHRIHSNKQAFLQSYLLICLGNFFFLISLRAIFIPSPTQCT